MPKLNTLTVYAWLLTQIHEIIYSHLYSTVHYAPAEKLLEILPSCSRLDSLNDSRAFRTSLPGWLNRDPPSRPSYNPLSMQRRKKRRSDMQNRRKWEGISASIVEKALGRLKKGMAHKYIFSVSTKNEENNNLISK